MPAKHRRNRAIELPDGDLVTQCPMCEASPVRASWLRACEDCGLSVCRVCMPESETVCTGCAHARATLEVAV